MKWYLVVFIYISPLSNDVEQLFLWSLAIFFFFFGELSVQIFARFILLF